MVLHHRQWRVDGSGRDRCSYRDRYRAGWSLRDSSGNFRRIMWHTRGRCAEVSELNSRLASRRQAIRPLGRGRPESVGKPKFSRPRQIQSGLNETFAAGAKEDQFDMCAAVLRQARPGRSGTELQTRLIVATTIAIECTRGHFASVNNL